MKKAIILVLVMMIFFISCSSYSEETPEISITADQTISETNSVQKYFITFEIKQFHFTLDIFEHIKDDANKITMTVMVDKDYYDMYSVGDTINDDFRWGSFIFHGSFGNWKVTIKDKTIS